MTPVNLCMQNFGQWKPQTNHQTTETWMQMTDFHRTCGLLSATFCAYRDSLPRTCKDSGATLLPQTAQGCFAKENGPQSAGVIENHEKYPSLIL